MKNKKLKPIPKLIKQASDLAQLWARLKDADDRGMCKCVTCGKVDHYKHMQGGHFIERGKAATRLNPVNISPQCPWCNMYGMKRASVVLKYRDHLVTKHGESVVSCLETMSKQTRKWSRIELEEIIGQLNDKIKSKKAELMI